MQILSLLAAPLNALILHKLVQGPRRLVELRRETGAAQTTLRARLRELVRIGAVTRRRLHSFPSAREYMLAGQRGRELRFVSTTLGGWLAKAPRGPLPLGGDEAQAAVKAFAEGWSSTVLRALGDGPLNLAELNGSIAEVDRPVLERRLAAMRLAGQVEVQPGSDGSPSYAVTEWLRQSMAPLAAAMRWERNHLPGETAATAPLDAEAGFLLALPLLSLPTELSGTCRLGVEFDVDGEPRLAGATIGVEDGRVVHCTARLERGPSAWAIGPVRAWLRVAIEADPGYLGLGGDERLASAVLDGLNRALFTPLVRVQPPDPL